MKTFKEHFKAILRGDLLTESKQDEQEYHKFDCVVGNPPYMRGQHMQFMEQAFELGDQVVFVHPSAWLFGKTPNRQIPESDMNCIDIVKSCEGEFTILNGTSTFDGAVFSYPLVISSVKTKIPSKDIKVIDAINNKQKVYKNFDDVNLYCKGDSYIKLRNKLISKAEGNSVQDYVDNTVKRGVGVVLGKVRGNYTDKDKFFADDFYTMIPRDCKPVKKGTDFTCWFETEKEAENFIHYLKSDVARFCLSLYKFGITVCGGGITGAIPMLSMKQKWTEGALCRRLDITPSELKIIKTIIPPYYEDI